MVQIISFIIIFGLMVFVHELGHFIAARIVGVRVHEFALGFGPSIVTKQGKDTLYALRALPLGGYVKLEGEDSASNPDDESSLSNKSPLQKIFVFVAGGLMNFLLAFVLFAVLFGTTGIPTGSNTVGGVQETMPAASAGIMAGDKIISVNGIPTSDWKSMTNVISTSEGIVVVKIERNGSLMDIKVNPVDEGGSKKLGILPEREFSALGAVSYGAQTTWDLTKRITTFLISIPINGVSGKDLMGPVGLFQVVGEASTSSNAALSLASLTAVLSVNLGIFNLLPFPALDGGRIIVSLFELITRKKVDPEKEGRFHMIGFALLLLLIVFTVVNDISRFFGG